MEALWIIVALIIVLPFIIIPGMILGGKLRKRMEPEEEETRSGSPVKFILYTLLGALIILLFIASLRECQPS